MSKKPKGDPFLMGLMHEHSDASMISEMTHIHYDWMRYFRILALNRVKWTGLPDTVDERYLELALLNHGRAVIYDAMAGTSSEPLILGTRVSPAGEPDLYGNYNDWISLGEGGHYQEINNDFSAVIHDSRERSPVMPVIERHVLSLTKLDMSANLNRDQQRQQKILQAPHESEADTMALLKSISQGKPFIVRGKDFADRIDVMTLDFSVEYKQADFQEDRMNLINSLLSKLGIKNIPVEKTQYQNTIEVGIANDSISRVREDLLSQRRVAADRINEMFGLNVAVDWALDEYGITEGEPSAASDHYSENIEENENE